MPLFRRVAKRGFGNAAFKTEYVAINLDQLAEKFKASGKVTMLQIREAFSLRRDAKVKALGRGSVSVAIDVELHAVSASAAQAISDAGGTVTIV